jgi:hypothetical protein
VAALTIFVVFENRIFFIIRTDHTIDSQLLGKDRRSAGTPGISTILVIIKKGTLGSGS